jgi:hypothetical protein
MSEGMQNAEQFAYIMRHQQVITIDMFSASTFSNHNSRNKGEDHDAARGVVFATLVGALVWLVLIYALMLA